MNYIVATKIRIRPPINMIIEIVTQQNLNLRHPTKTIRIKVTSKNRRMVKKSFLGTMIYLPQSGNRFQTTAAADTTNVTHVYVVASTRYDELNQEFNFKKV